MSLKKIWGYEEEENFPGMTFIINGEKKTFEEIVKEKRAKEKEAEKKKDK